jgi:8-oxo-dGTP pyrophosphatase MutT (NUDIX family)
LSNQLPTHRYASAGGVVTDPTGERVLVLLRPNRLGPDGQPEVRLPKGHIEPGESRRQTALREVCEEAGLADLDILADLGHLTVEFDWRGCHYVRDESCFLMTAPADTQSGRPEKQFERLWTTWEETLGRLTFEAEREWVRRARSALAKQSHR